MARVSADQRHDAPPVVEEQRIQQMLESAPNYLVTSQILPNGWLSTSTEREPLPPVPARKWTIPKLNPLVIAVIGTVCVAFLVLAVTRSSTLEERERAPSRQGTMPPPQPDVRGELRRLEELERELIRQYPALRPDAGNRAPKAPDAG